MNYPCKYLRVYCTNVLRRNGDFQVKTASYCVKASSYCKTTFMLQCREYVEDKPSIEEVLKVRD